MAERKPKRPTKKKARQEKENLPAKRNPDRRSKRIQVGTRNTKILEGEEDLSDWDVDELIRGRKRDRNGHFSGRPPSVVPQKIHEELMRRTLSEVTEIIREAAVPAATKLSEMVQQELDIYQDDEGRIQQERLDPTQLRACQEVLERVLGKAKERIEISAEIKPWERAVGTVTIVGTREDADEIIDAEIVDEEDIEEEDDDFEDEEEWEDDDEEEEEYDD